MVHFTSEKITPRPNKFYDSYEVTIEDFEGKVCVMINSYKNGQFIGKQNMCRCQSVERAWRFIKRQKMRLSDPK